MRGIDRLEAIRRSGKVPRDGVVFHVDAGRPALPPQQQELDGRAVRIDVDATEHLARADVRAVFGLRVVVLGDNEAACATLARRCVECGASAVIAAAFELVVSEGWRMRTHFAHNPWVHVHG